MNLNGYTLKAVKMMETHYGISFSGNIYFNGKIIGSAYNNGRGGMTDVNLSPGHHDHYPVLSENFVERLFTLNDYEKSYKANVKNQPDKGMAVIIYTDPFDMSFLMCEKNIKMDKIIAYLNKTNAGRKIESIEIFRSLDSFNIDQDHLPEIYENMYLNDDMVSEAEQDIEP